MPPIQGVILDIDGTLVDSNDAHAHSWIEALAEHGLNVPFEQVRRLIGKGGDKLLPEVSGIKEDSAEGKKIGKRRQEIFKKTYLPSLQPTPGAKELLQHMRSAGLKLVVASSAKKEELTPLLRVCGAEKLIEDQTSSDDAERSKPDPDIIHAALKQIALAADKVIMLGDTPYDVEAASKAGIRTIAVRCGGWDDTGLAGAAAVYNDPADLLAHFESSPFATGKG